MRFSVSDKYKIILPSIILLLMLLTTSGSISYSSINKLTELKKLKQEILFISDITSLLHDIQKERGLSVGFNGNKQFKKEMLDQRRYTTQNLQSFIEKLKTVSFSSKRINREQVYLLALFSKLNSFRNSIDKGDVDYRDILSFYTKINTKLLDILIDIAKDSHGLDATLKIQAFIHLLRLNEYTGIERAWGAILLSKHFVNRADLLSLSNTIALKNNSESLFLHYANPKERKEYREFQEYDFVKKTAAMQHMLLYEDIGTVKVSSKEWFSIITKTINTLSTISRDMEQALLHTIQKQFLHKQHISILLIIVMLLSLFLFTVMIITLLKVLENEKKLRTIMNKYVISSTADSKGKIIDVSEAFCEISGYTKEELLGKPHNIVRHPDMPSEVFCQMWAQLKSGSKWSGK